VWDRAEKDLKAAVEALDLAYTLNPARAHSMAEARIPPARCDRPTMAMRYRAARLQHAGALGAVYVARMADDTRRSCCTGRSSARWSASSVSDRALRRPFPALACPVQAVVASITDEAAAYAEEVAGELRAAGLRVVIDTSNEKIGYKVREHSLAKVPLMLVVGRREPSSAASRCAGSQPGAGSPLRCESHC